MLPLRLQEEKGRWSTPLYNMRYENKPPIVGSYHSATVSQNKYSRTAEFFTPKNQEKMNLVPPKHHIHKLLQPMSILQSQNHPFLTITPTVNCIFVVIVLIFLKDHFKFYAIKHALSEVCNYRRISDTISFMR